MNIVKWAPIFVAVIVLGFFSSNISFAQFTPVDNYLLACGSSQNVTFLACRLLSFPEIILLLCQCNAIVSIPDNLISDQAVALSPYGPISGLSGLALETVYRLNMGGPLVTAQNDTLGRTWENDVKYLHVNSSAVNVSVSPSNIKYGASVSPEIAPNYVYATAETMGEANVANVNFNITWVFEVDPNFSYLVRVHFCDIVSKSLNSLIFNLYINTDIAIGSLDLSNQAGNLDVPYYRDFVAKTSADSNTLTVSVGPDTNTDLINAIMNGLEIMKMSNDVRSLTGTLPVDNLLVLPPKKNKTGIIIGSVVGAFAAMVFIGLCYFCLAARRSKEAQQGSSWLPLPLYGNSLTVTKMSTTSQKSGTASCITIECTKGPSKTELELPSKRKSEIRARPRGIRIEIEMLSKLRHRHLVSLIGYCDERSEMILVSRIHGERPPPEPSLRDRPPSLSWKQRLEICIGAARGLHYLHTGATQSIIHRDVKNNKYTPRREFRGEVLQRQQLTEKSDVYSLGVVLMEVLCTRPALNPVLPREQVNIAEWAMAWQRKGMLEHIMDKNLVGKLEETSSALMEPDDNSTNHIPGIPLTPLEPFDNSVSMIEGGHSGTDDDAEDAATSAVFSQLVNPRGR
ncbi:hypothetical protein DH2020_008564 [Rehmannia glutinosa]|uniref:Protein kinase domain-containing protein n=1 Tax=Rehmannia glutinosa TaxID=99300 RepID=A0ABR0X530_REHGL